MKKILIALVGVFVLLILLVVAIPFLIPMEKFRVEIERTINSKITGHAEIRDLKLSFFPWLGIKASGILLQNGETFKNSDLLRVQELGLHVEVMPLLKKRVVGEIIIDKPVIRLETLADGRASAAMIMKADKSEKPKADAKAAEKPIWLDEMIRTAKITSLVIKNAELRKIEYDDKMQRKGGTDVAKLDVRLENLGLHDEIPVRLAAAVFNSDRQDVEFQGILASDIDLNRPEQRLTIKASTVKLGDIAVQMNGLVILPEKKAAILDLTAKADGIVLSRVEKSLPMLKGKMPPGIQGDLSFVCTVKGPSSPTEALHIDLKADSKVIAGVQPNVDLQNTQTEITVHDNIATIKKFETSVLSGKVTSTGTVQLVSQMVNMDVKIDKLDIGQANNAVGKTKDLVKGLMDVDVHVEGIPSSTAPADPKDKPLVPAWLKSQGKLHIGAGQLTSLNLMGDTVALLVKVAPIDESIRNALSRVTWNSVDSTFHTDNGALTMAPLRMDYGPSIVDGQGTIAANSGLKFAGLITIDKATVQKMGGNLPYLANKKGEMEIPYRVDGTLSKPITYPDVSSLLKKAVKQELQKIVPPEVKSTLNDLTNLLKAPAPKK